MQEPLHDELRWIRGSLLAKLDGLGEHDLRRPLTRTGTNLLGLVKHVGISEARYLGDAFGRPFPGPLPDFSDPGYDNRDHLWVREDESSAEVVTLYREACAHADATIEALPPDAPGRVPWWPRPDVRLVNVVVHVLVETSRHVGHADILREHLDGGVGENPVVVVAEDDPAWALHFTEVARAATAAQARWT